MPYIEEYAKLLGVHYDMDYLSSTEPEFQFVVIQNH